MKETLRMNEWPAYDRPYEKMEMLGARSLSDTELIAIILGSGKNGKTSVELARQLINLLGGFTFVESASLEELRQISGIGRVKAIRLKAAIELGKRMSNALAHDQKQNIGSSDSALLYFANLMQSLPREEFYVALLNVKQDLIRVVQVATGDIKSIELDAREIFREAIRSNAAGIILAHNHPSGDPSPSEQDILTTQKIISLGQELRVPILDHIIVGVKKSISMRAEGYI